MLEIFIAKFEYKSQFNLPFLLYYFTLAMTWFKTVRPRLVDSMMELCRSFTIHFTASYKQSNFVDSPIELSAREEERPCTIITRGSLEK